MTIRDTALPLNVQTITFFISVLNYDPAQQHAPKLFPGVRRNKAIVTLLSDQASDIVSRLSTAHGSEYWKAFEYLQVIRYTIAPTLVSIKFFVVYN